MEQYPQKPWGEAEAHAASATHAASEAHAASSWSRGVQGCPPCTARLKDPRGHQPAQVESLAVRILGRVPGAQGRSRLQTSELPATSELPTELPTQTGRWLSARMPARDDQTPPTKPRTAAATDLDRLMTASPSHSAFTPHQVSKHSPLNKSVSLQTITEAVSLQPSHSFAKSVSLQPSRHPRMSDRHALSVLLLLLYYSRA